MGHEMENV